MLLLLRKPGPAEGGEAKSSRKSSGRADPTKVEDPAETAKKVYLERTQPEGIQSVRAIMAMVKPDWHLLVFAYASLVVAAAGDTTIPFLYGQLIDAIAINRDPDKFTTYMLLLVLTAVVTGVFTGFRGSTFIVIGGRFSVRLRRRLFSSLMRQELDFFSAVRTGDMTSRLSADCQKVGDQVQLNVNVFLRSVIQVLFTLGFMVHISWRLALTCFVAVPCIVYASKIFGDFMRTLSTETQDALAESNSAAEEVLGSISTTRAFAAEASEDANYAKGMAHYNECVVRTARLYYVYSSTTFTLLPYCAYCLVLYYGAQLTQSPVGCSPTAAHGAQRCAIDASGLVSFVFYMQSLFAAFTSIGNIYTALAQAIGAADKVLKWIERVPQLVPDAAPLVPARCAGDLKMVDVTFRYALRPERAVLSGLSLHVKPGEVVALCGPSGGGKSSCISLLERFYEPQAGQVLLDDVPIAQLEAGWFHRQVALVGQEPVLFARSIEDNICYGLDGECRPSSEEVHAAALLANAHDFVMSFELGYGTSVGERGAQLSGGQKQRIAIARALVRHPSVLLLDEATSALDAESEGVVQAAIDRMISQGGMTVLMIAHRLSTIRNADRICVIKGGCVAEQGRHEELMARPGGEYAKLVSKQMQMHSASAGSDLAAQGSSPEQPRRRAAN
jgi:ATP-binding cassette subfamily B (MDR/TAP) protein 9